jgi:hypothetical protein
MVSQRELGESRFAQLRELLVELNQIAAREAASDAPPSS